MPNEPTCVIEDITDQTEQVNAQATCSDAGAGHAPETISSSSSAPLLHDSGSTQQDPLPSSSSSPQEGAGDASSTQLLQEEQQDNPADQQEQKQLDQQHEKDQQERQQQPWLPASDEEQQQLDAAEALKKEGNGVYAQERYEEALQKYHEALEAAPAEAPQRAIYYANMAACCLKMEQPRLAAEHCSCALRIDDGYVKALMRRAAAFEEMDDPDHALQDAQKVLQLDPGSSWASSTVRRLEPVVKERQERLKEEMLGKLKDLGNSLLGKFGLSLDNFKTEQDPATGGYSIKFQQ